MTTGFKKATKTQAKGRIALLGPSGSGKTYTALRIARGLSPDGRIAVIDTECGSASLYSDQFEFDVLELTTYQVEKFIAGIHDAERAGYDVAIIDSLSHAWSGTGGILDYVNDETKRQKSQNSYAAWRNATPKHNELIDAILKSRMHIIATMRTKTAHVQEKDERTGKTVIRKMGMETIQRDGFEYEFTMVIDLDLEHNGVVSKSRCASLADRVMLKPGEDFGREFAAWLNDGAPAPQSAPAPAPLPEPAPNTQSHTTERAVKAISTFSEMGVTEYQLLEFVGADSVEEITAEQLGAIANAYKDIRAKKTTAAALFPTMLSEPAPEFEEAATPATREPGEDDF